MAYKKFTTFPDLLQHYLSIYYKTVEMRPIIRQDATQHEKLIKHTNQDYLEALKIREKQFNYEEHKDKFIEAIEIRTNFQKKARELQEKKQRNKALLESVKK